MPYCITLRSRTDALITGWYDGSDSRWSTDRYRQKVFDNKRLARPVCDELRSLCPRNAEVINVEAEQDDPSRDGDFTLPEAEAAYAVFLEGGLSAIELRSFLDLRLPKWLPQKIPSGRSDPMTVFLL